MKRLLIVLVLVAACVVGLGFYLGWFHLTVDKDKFQEDKEKALPKTQDSGHRVKDVAATPGGKGQPGELLLGGGEARS
jgi:hypothetical protein